MARFHRAAAAYEIGERFVDAALRRDDSLFTPGRAIWTRDVIAELYERYVKNPDLGSGSFETKLKGQLAGASPAVIQLMAEVMYIYFLPASNMTGRAKRARLNEVLDWSLQPVAIPDELAAALDKGIGSGGSGFHLYKWASLVYLVLFARAWKELDPAARERALADPWQFRAVAFEVPTEGGGTYARESLLHLVFPDTFERMFAVATKHQAADAFREMSDLGAVDVDRRIHRIRETLTPRYGSDFDFYETDGVRALWGKFKDPLDELLYWGSRFHELESYEAEERTYKLEVAGNMAQARDALVVGGDWYPRLKRAFGPPNNLTHWQLHDTFVRWLNQDLGNAEKLLRRLWDHEGDPLARLADFFVHFPKSVIPGLGGRTSLASVLMLAVDPRVYPPYRVAALHAAYKLAHFDAGDEKDEVAMYRAALAFFDRLIERGREKGVDLVDRLDAQSIAWCVVSWDAPEEWPAEDRAAFARYRAMKAPEEIDEPLVDGPKSKDDVDPLAVLAEDLLIPYKDLDEIRTLIERKGQAIFYGPPGTGKTYVARRLAAALAGQENGVRVVQFHPSYAYEDFVEGYRPRLIDGTPAFELVSGPLRRLAEEANNNPAHTYYLIIDELNRGNVAKVFGELYFLLEYRDEEIELQYSDLPFRLPANLRIIGTMNTADRSIALLDAALRRRFTFVPFFPDRPPIAGVLSRWLGKHRPELLWVSDVVELANKRLADRNGAIGPSFFMDKDLDAAGVARVWEHEILPYLEDYFFDQPERLSEFQLAALKAPALNEVEPTADATFEEDEPDAAAHPA